MAAGGWSATGSVSSAGERLVAWLRTRTGAVVAGVVALALATSGASAAVLATDADVFGALGSGPVSDTTEEPVDCRTEVPSLTEAMTLAVACGTEVEATDERNAWQSTFATPESQVRLETGTEAIRSDVDGNGTWAEIDTSVTDDGDGRLDVAAPATPMSFADGSVPDAPLARVETSGGELVDVAAPVALTEAEIDGDEITYPEVLNGVDLVVTVNQDGTGWTQALRFDTPQAVRASPVADLGLDEGPEVRAPGLRIAREHGAFQVIDGDTGAAGASSEIVASARPVVQVSEQASSEAPAPAAARSSKAQNAGPEQATEVVEPEDGASIADTLSAVAADSSTAFPVFAATAVSGTLGEVTAVRSAWPTSSSSYQFEGDAGVGRCVASDPNAGWECGLTSSHRILYEFGGLSKIGGLSSSDVTAAEFRVYGTHSYNCSMTPTAVYQVGSAAVSSSTTWNTMGSWSTRLGIQMVNHREGCSGLSRWIGFDVLAGAKKVASSGWSALTLGLKSDESSMTSWKRYIGRTLPSGSSGGRGALSITYNQRPAEPTSLQTVQLRENFGCHTGTYHPHLRTVQPTISAVLKDPDGNSLKGRFQVYRVSNNTKVWGAYSGYLGSGKRHTLRVGTELDGNNVLYKWRVLAVDREQRQGSWSRWCEFRVNNVRPDPPSIDAVTTGVETVYVKNEDGKPAVESGGIGLTGKFKFGRKNPDVVRFKFGFNDPARPHGVTAGSTGTSTISFTPKEPQVYSLTAIAVDQAGNESLPATYRFDVASPQATGIWRMDEGTGTTVADGSWVRVKSPLTLTDGASWTDGPHELFGSRIGDNALQLDGVNDRAVTGGPVLNTDKSFVVSAHVMLDADADLSRSQAVLSQNGGQVSPFVLGWYSDCRVQTGCWHFAMRRTSSATPQSVRVYAPAGTGAQAGKWVHLTAAYNATSDQLSLYTCTIGTPDQPTPAEPILTTSAETLTTPWAATGPFIVGRDSWDGTQVNFFDGRIDNVRVFDGQLVAENKVRRLCQGADDYDFVRAGTALDPTAKDITLDSEADK